MFLDLCTTWIWCPSFDLTKSRNRIFHCTLNSNNWTTNELSNGDGKSRKIKKFVSFNGKKQIGTWWHASMANHTVKTVCDSVLDRWASSISLYCCTILLLSPVMTCFKSLSRYVGMFVLLFRVFFFAWSSSSWTSISFGLAHKSLAVLKRKNCSSCMRTKLNQ